MLDTTPAAGIVPAALSTDGTVQTQHVTMDRYGAAVADGATTAEVVAALAASPEDDGAAWRQADLLVWLAERYGAAWRLHKPPDWALSLRTAANRLWIGRTFSDRAWRRPHVDAGLSMRHFEAVARIAGEDMDAAGRLLTEAARAKWTSDTLARAAADPVDAAPALDDLDLRTVALPTALTTAAREWFTDAGWRRVSAETIGALVSHLLYVQGLWSDAQGRGGRVAA